jgi:hypothetical protein
MSFRYQSQNPEAPKILPIRKMRRTLGIILLITLFSCNKPVKPEGLILKVQYQPEKTYYISTIRGTETVITYSGQDIAMRKLKSMHVQNPTISKVRTKTDMELVTGKSSADSGFQVSLTYKKTMSLDGKNNTPEGTVVKGELKGESQPVFKSVVSSALGIDQRIQLLKTIQNTFDQFNFPGKQLKIGDTLSVSRPMTMAMEGSEIETIVRSTYKLISIDKNFAQFELAQIYKMTPKRLDNSFTGTGQGEGKMTYDISKKIISDYSLRTEINMNKKLDYFEFDLKTTNEFSQQTSLQVK